jgi:hypothetical protein
MIDNSVHQDILQKIFSLSIYCIILTSLHYETKEQIEENENERLTGDDIDRLVHSYNGQVLYMYTVMRSGDNKELFLRLNYNNYLTELSEKEREK